MVRLRRAGWPHCVGGATGFPAWVSRLRLLTARSDVTPPAARDPRSWEDLVDELVVFTIDPQILIVALPRTSARLLGKCRELR